MPLGLVSRRPPSDADFTAFVEASWPSLYRTAYFMLGDRADAEDLVQTALAQTYGSWHRVRDLGAARAYARATMMNTAAGWFRKRGWRNELPSADPPDHDDPTLGDPTDRPVLIDALRALSPRQRAVIVLRFYEDLSVSETAQALECSQGTVKSTTHDALARLRVLLGDVVIPDPMGARHE